MNATQVDRYIDYGQAAELLSLSVGSLRNLVSEKKISHFKIGARVRFSVSELHKFMHENKVEARTDR
ncbi:MAG TPA: helix-turn-helix domain-containing protein [bacterium]|nr:helix-turn-helix domain-containing protein [bacterium]